MLKGKMDKKLKSVMTKEPYKLPDSYQERVKQTLDALPTKMDSQVRCYPKRAIALVPVMVLLLMVTSVSAGSVLEEHLSKMDSKDIQKYLDTIENHAYIQADTYTRELTDAERKRREELNQAYIKGTYPDNVLPIYETMEQAQGTPYCYIEESGTFKLPETELTDEQLLQLIDFQEKRSYCLDKESRKSSEEEEAQSIIGVTEEEAIAYAKEQVERFYQVDISEYEVISETMESYYSIEFRKDGCGYEVSVDIENGQLYSIGLYMLDGLNRDDCSLDKALLAEAYNTTRKALENYLSSESTITRSCYVYEGDDTIICRGMAHYIFEDADGKCYDLVYNFNMNQIHTFVTGLDVDYSTYLEHYKNSEEVDEKSNEDISWKIIDMDTK